MDIYLCSLCNIPTFYCLVNGEPISFLLYDLRGYPEAIDTLKSLISAGF